MLKIFNFSKENSGKLKPVTVKGYIADGKKFFPLFTTSDKILALTSFNAKKDKNSRLEFNVPIGVFEIKNPNLMIGDYGIVIGDSLLSLNNPFQRKQLLSLIHMVNMMVSDNPLWEETLARFDVVSAGSSSADYGSKLDEAGQEVSYLAAAEKFGQKTVSKAYAKNGKAYNAAMKKAAKRVYKNAEKTISESIKEGVDKKFATATTI